MQTVRVLGLPATITAEASGVCTAELDSGAGICSQCGRTLQKNGRVSITLHDLPRGRQPTVLTLTAQRYRCKSGCERPDPWSGIRCEPVAGRHPAYTARLFDELLDRFLRGTPASELAAWCGGEVQGLRRLLRSATLERVTAERRTDHLATITHVGIDEVFWEGRILTVILDLTTGQPIELLPERSVDMLRAFLDDFNAFCPAPPVFVTDMWSEFRTVLHSVYGPQVRHVCDRFHVEAKVTEDLREAANHILPVSHLRPRQVRQVLDHYLRSAHDPHRPLIVDGATNEQLAHLRRVLSLAEGLRSFWACTEVAQAEQHLQDWCWSRAEAQWQQRQRGVPGQPFGRLEYVLRIWRAEVLAYFDPAVAFVGGRRPSTGRLEAANGQTRRLLRESRHRRRRPFSHALDAQDEQAQFDALWVRIMHRLSAPRAAPTRLTGRVRPAVPPCPCGAPASEAQCAWTSGPEVWDQPLGEVPVRVTAEDTHVVCLRCGRASAVEVPRVHGMTPRLLDDVLAWRRAGLSLRALHRMTGVSIARLRAATQDALPVVAGPAPDLIGLQRWRWRRHDHWVITDPVKGTLVDLVRVEEDTREGAEEALQAWWQRHPEVRRVLVGDLLWAGLVPGRMSALADRFTALSPVHRALRDAVRQVAGSLTAAELRHPDVRGFRSLFLANGYRRLDDRLAQAKLDRQRKDLMGRPPFNVLSPGWRRVAQFRSLSALGEPEMVRQGLQRWCQSASNLATKLQGRTEPGNRGLRFGFLDAVRQLEEHEDAVVDGLVLQHRAGVSLASSRRLLQSLRAHPATRQGDFEFLRLTAVVTLGDR